MNFFGLPEDDTALLMGGNFEMQAMPLSMLFTLMLLSGVVTLIFNFAVERRLFRDSTPALTKELSTP